MLQLQQQLHLQAPSHSKVKSSCRSRSHLTCQASRRNMQHADKQSSRITTESSSCDTAVSVAVPIEQVVPAQQSRNGFSMVGVLAVAAVAAGFLFKKLRSNGYDPFARDYMQNVNAMQMDELDPEIIAAARARRSRERANHRLDLDDIDLPENHPWATRKPVTAEQEAAIEARLKVRPRRVASDARQGGAHTRQLGRE